MNDDTNTRGALLELDLNGPPARITSPAAEMADAVGRLAARDERVAASIAHDERDLRDARAERTYERDQRDVAKVRAADAAAAAALGLDMGKARKTRRVEGVGTETAPRGRRSAGAAAPAFGRDLDSAVRRRWEAAPTMTTLSHQIRGALAAESRVTRPHALRGLYLASSSAGMDTIGRLCAVDTGNTYDLGETAYKLLARMAPPEMTGVLGFNLNAWTHRAPETKVVHLRSLTHREHGRRVAFTAVSGRYVAYDMDAAAADIAAALPADARARLSYNGDGGRWQVEATIARPLDVDGDVHEMGVVIDSADDATRGYKMQWAAYRLLCSNGLRISSRSLALQLRHTKSLGEAVRVALQNVEPAMESFRTTWQAAHDRGAVDTDGKSVAPVDALMRLAEARVLKVSGVKPEDLGAALVGSWSAEKGDDVASIVNAVTRAAHEYQWSRWADRDELEEQAGRLLYQHVLTIPDAPAIEA